MANLEKTDLLSSWINYIADPDHNEAASKGNYRDYSRYNYSQYILNAVPKGLSSMESLNYGSSVSISKVNTSFDFAEKFREFLLNGDYQKNDNLINFLGQSGNEIGRLIYERIQNYLNNFVNIDSCHYQALVSAYASYNIDISDSLIKNLPVELEYLVNMLSLPKSYYKGAFYSLSVSDLDIQEDIENIKTTKDLETVDQALNRKYFDNFYENVAYPIIRSELYAYKNEDKFKEFIDQSSNGVYDGLLEGNYADFTFLNLIKQTFSDETIRNIAGLMTYNFLNQEIFFKTFTEPNAKYSDDANRLIHADYFYTLLTSRFNYYVDENNELETFDASTMFYGEPTNTSINFKTPTYVDVFNMFEEYFATREEVVEILKVRLAAKKLANLCNRICKLRQEIKEIRLKDSKVGTALLIEELISDFIYKALTQKVGLTNQKYANSDLSNVIDDIENSFDETNKDDKLIKDQLTDIFEAEQRAIGIKFEKYYETLSALVKKLKVEIVEYYDSTPSYLNIIPTIESVRRKKFYRVKKVECPPYLNINGLLVYADFDDKENFFTHGSLEQIRQLLPQCSVGSEKVGYRYFFKKDYDTPAVEVFLDENKQLYYTTKEEPDKKIRLYEPEDSYKMRVADNINKSTWDSSHNWYGFNDGVDSFGAPIKKIVDLYDRTITWSTEFALVDANGADVMVFRNGHQVSPDNRKLIQQKSSIGFVDYYSGFQFPVSRSDVEFLEPDESSNEWVVGFFTDGKGGMFQTGKTDGSTVWVPLILITKENYENTASIKKFYDTTYGLNFYIKLLGNDYYQDKFDSIDVKTFTTVNRQKFILDSTGESLNYNTNNQLYDSQGMVLNYYATDVEKFYNLSNAKVVFKDETKDILVALDGNEPFWNLLSYENLYSDKTVDEEAEIIRFYKNLGLIDDNLSSDYKTVHYDGSESLTQPWASARYNLIKKLKEFWAINAQNIWYDPVLDDARLAAGELDKETAKNLKNMDIAYHSNLGQSMANNPRVQTLNSITNLENWENNTVAIHPCVWNLVEKSYDSYIKVINASTFGEDILNKIFSEPYSWPTGMDKSSDPDNFVHNQGSVEDMDGMYSVETLKDEAGRKRGFNVHTVDYWKNYGKSLFAYETEYEASTNETSNGAKMSRCIDFDGPLNYEALLEVIDHWWTGPEIKEEPVKNAGESDSDFEKRMNEYQEWLKDADGSIRKLDLKKYYIDIAD